MSEIMSFIGWSLPDDPDYVPNNAFGYAKTETVKDQIKINNEVWIRTIVEYSNSCPWPGTKTYLDKIGNLKFVTDTEMCFDQQTVCFSKNVTTINGKLNIYRPSSSKFDIKLWHSKVSLTEK